MVSQCNYIQRQLSSERQNTVLKYAQVYVSKSSMTTLKVYLYLHVFYRKNTENTDDAHGAYFVSE